MRALFYSAVRVNYLTSGFTSDLNAGACLGSLALIGLGDAANSFSYSASLNILESPSNLEPSSITSLPERMDPLNELPLFRQIVSLTFTSPSKSPQISRLSQASSPLSVAVSPIITRPFEKIFPSKYPSKRMSYSEWISPFTIVVPAAMRLMEFGLVATSVLAIIVLLIFVLFLKFIVLKRLSTGQR